jgi:hypothetical protein
MYLSEKSALLRESAFSGWSTSANFNSSTVDLDGISASSMYGPSIFAVLSELYPFVPLTLIQTVGLRGPLSGIMYRLLFQKAGVPKIVPAEEIGRRRSGVRKMRSDSEGRVEAGGEQLRRCSLVGNAGRWQKSLAYS